MEDNPHSPPSGTITRHDQVLTRRVRMRRWVSRNRRGIVAHFARGVAYGAGLGLMGLVVWMIENH